MALRFVVDLKLKIDLQHIVHDPLAQYLGTLPLKLVATYTMQREQGASSSSTLFTIVMVKWHARAAFAVRP